MCFGKGGVADPDRIVTVTIPATGRVETATCGEWFGVGCEFVEPDPCPDYQEALEECCVDSAPVEPTPRPPTPAPADSGGNSVRDVLSIILISIYSQ